MSEKSGTGQYKSKFKPYKDEQLLTQMESVFHAAMIELKRRNKLPRIAMSEKDMERPREKNKVYDEVDVESMKCKTPTGIRKTEWPGIKKQVLVRYRNFLCENGAEIPIDLNRPTPMPQALLEEKQQPEQETGYYSMKHWGYYTTDFLKYYGNDSRAEDGKECDSYTGAWRWESMKSDWKIRKTADYENLLEEKKRDEEKEKKAANNKASRQKKESKSLFLLIEVIAKALPPFDISAIEKSSREKIWLSVEDTLVKLENKPKKGHLRNQRMNDNKMQCGEDGALLGIDNDGRIYYKHCNARIYYYHLTVDTKSKKFQNFYKQYNEKHSE